LKQGQWRTIAAADLTDEEVASIDAAEVPLEHRYSVKDVG
jgi:hypothetical protein